MLLKVKGLKIAPRLKIHEVADKPPKENDWDDSKPKHLIPLGDAMWPDEIKEDITQQFKRIGVEDPYKQKLVEPYALVFGGIYDDGAYKLDKVNWEMVMDYFRWESSAWDRDTDAKTKTHDQLVEEIKAKHGGMFNHQMVYLGPEGEGGW